LYKKARRGELSEFTGVDAPYETPLQAELTLHTAQEDMASSLKKLITYVLDAIPLQSPPR